MSKITAHSLLWLKATWAHWIRKKDSFTTQPRILAFWDKTPVNIKYCITYFISSLHGFLLGAERALGVFVWHSIQALCLWHSFGNPASTCLGIDIWRTKYNVDRLMYLKSLFPVKPQRESVLRSRIGTCTLSLSVVSDSLRPHEQ